jgi:hypothetical protein
MVEIFQNLGMVPHAVVVKISNQVAGEIRTIGTSGNPGVFFSAVPYLAGPAIGCKRSPAKASVAVTVVFRHIPYF